MQGCAWLQEGMHPEAAAREVLNNWQHMIRLEPGAVGSVRPASPSTAAAVPAVVPQGTGGGLSPSKKQHTLQLQQQGQRQQQQQGQAQQRSQQQQGGLGQRGAGVEDAGKAARTAAHVAALKQGTHSAPAPTASTAPINNMLEPRPPVPLEWMAVKTQLKEQGLLTRECISQLAGCVVLLFLHCLVGLCSCNM